MSYTFRKLDLLPMILCLILAGCIPKRRGFSADNSTEVKIALVGLGYSSILKESPKFALSTCQKNSIFGSLSPENIALFLNVPTMASGSTCTVEISDSKDQTEDASIKWLDRPGLRYRDTNVVVSQNSSRGRSGEAKHLKRMFDIITPETGTNIQLTTKVHRSSEVKLDGKMEVTLNCTPLAPYFTTIEAKQFDIDGDADERTGSIVFTLPGSKDVALQYSCNSMIVFRNYTIVAVGIPSSPIEVKIPAGGTKASSDVIFEWDVFDPLVSNVEINPEVSKQ